MNLGSHLIYPSVILCRRLKPGLYTYTYPCLFYNIHVYMLPLLSPLYNIRDPATIIIRELVYSLVNKEDFGMPVHASSASALRPCFPPHLVPKYSGKSTR